MSEFEKDDQPPTEIIKMKPEEMRLANVPPQDPPTSAPEDQLSYGRCTNRTKEILYVYGPGSKLYCLPPGHQTPDKWDCDGFYVPNDRVANQLLSNVDGPVAVKYVDIIHFEPTQEGTHYHCGGNQGVYKPGEIPWPIPNISYSDVVKGCKSG